MRWMRIGAAAVLAALAMPTAQAQAKDARQSVALVELFTSEGCSSCPPADALLRQLHGTRTANGVLVVGLSEHVTYWNRLGWADPFSDEAYTKRQDAYAERFGLDSPYTPQAVVNGERQVLGSDRAALLRAASSVAGKAELRIVSATAAGGQLEVTFEADGHGQAADVYAAVVDDQAVSRVGKSENAGRTLEHVAVARGLSVVGKIGVPGRQTVRVALPGKIAGQPETGRHVLVFAQAPGLGRVLALDYKELGTARAVAAIP